MEPSIDNILEQVQDLIDSLPVKSPTDLGLDRRSARRLYMGDTFLAVGIEDLKNLNYYGGFEYVSPEHVTHLGDYTLFSTDDSRVMEHWEQGLPRAVADAGYTLPC